MNRPLDVLGLYVLTSITRSQTRTNTLQYRMIF